MSYVWSSGPKDADVFLLSQGPGKAEGQIGKPFVGPSGEQQEMFLSFFNLTQKGFYLANLMKEWRPEDPRPNALDIERWGPVVEQEIRDVNPRVIAAVGGIAARWLLKPHYPNIDLSMDHIHGLAFDIPGHARDLITVIAIEHPASGIHSPRQKGSIWYDYSQLAAAIRGERLRYVKEDVYLGNETYLDVNGLELQRYILDSPGAKNKTLSIDTEGSLKHKDLWSIQVSVQPGTGATLRRTAQFFDRGIAFIQSLVDAGWTIVLHNALFDVPMCRLAGLELERARIFDTMYALFSLGGYERQGLDFAGFRFCGRQTDKFMGLVGDAARERQIAYIRKAAGINWDTPSKRKVVYNDGVIKDYKPGSMNSKLERILSDIEADKRDKDGNPVNPEDRFYRPPGSQQFHKDISAELIAEVEYSLGPFPYPSLADVPLEDAIRYASRDADVTLDLYYALLDFPDFQYNTNGSPCPRTSFDRGMRTLTAVEECQSTGIPRNRPYFVNLKNRFESEAADLQWKIAKEYFTSECETCQGKGYVISDDFEFSTCSKCNGTKSVTRAYNPRSHPQTRELLIQLGETGLEKTKITQEISTSEDSILHLQSKHEVIRDHFQAKHKLHLAGSFCRPPIERGDPRKDIDFVHSKWINTSIPSRRLATSGKDRKDESGFNLLAQPSRGEESLLIRRGYQCPDEYSFVSADLSQIEPRVLTHFSQEPKLLDIYLNNRDLYRETGATMQGCDSDTVTPDQRRGWKTFVLGQMYGFGGFTMMKLFFKSGIFWIPIAALGSQICKIDETDISQDGTMVRVTEYTCSILIDRWYALHPHVTEFKEDVAEFVRRTGYIDDASGIRRYLPDVRSRDFRDKGQAERQAVSHRVQGTAQTIIQESMYALICKFHELRNMNIDVRLALQYHDELVAICPTHIAPQIGEIIVWAMTSQHGYECSVPFKATWTTGLTWADLKD